MTPQLLEVQLKSGCFHLRYWPGGDRVLLVLHGFAQQGDVFAALVPYLRQQYTIYAPDLPFHGQTNWYAPAYNLGDMVALSQAVLNHSQQSKLTLLGYSLGGRLALALAPALAGSLQKLVLLAPDGIGGAHPRFIEHFPAWLRQMLVDVVASWDRLPVWAERFHRHNWISTGAYRYLLRYWQHENQRLCLMRTWLSLALFPVSKPHLLPGTGPQPVPTAIVLGRRDKLMSNKAIEDFFADCPHCRVSQVDAGHELTACPDKWYAYVGEL